MATFSESSSPSSPSLSATSTSSFGMISAHSHPSTRFHSLQNSDASSDDEIVWSASDAQGSLSSSMLSTESSVLLDDDDDFVVLSRRSPLPSASIPNPTAVNSATPSTIDADLTSALARLTLMQSSNRGAVGGVGVNVHVHTAIAPVAKVETGSTVQSKKKAKDKASVLSAPSPPRLNRPTSTATLTQATLIKPLPKKEKKGKARKKARKAKQVIAGLGVHPIVDDISENASEAGDGSNLSMYQDAVGYITTFLATPSAKDSVCHLTLLQSLIIELGLSSSSIPGSLTAAKTLIKSRAFLNIKEYLAVRNQGQAALRRIMHPSRGALIKDIRKKRNPASLKWVKQSGLQVLLVTCFR